jgi:hypothetical protein
MINFFVRILSNTAFTRGLLRVLPWPTLRGCEVMSSVFFKYFTDWKMQVKIMMLCYVHTSITKAPNLMTAQTSMFSSRHSSSHLLVRQSELDESMMIF